MNESSYILAIKQRLPASVLVWKIHDRFTVGVPDLYLAASGEKSLWVEAKYLQKPPVRAFTPRLSAEQRRWLNKHHEYQHKVMIIIGSPGGSTVVTPKTWGCKKVAPGNLDYDATIKIILEVLYDS